MSLYNYNISYVIIKRLFGFFLFRLKWPGGCTLVVGVRMNSWCGGLQVMWVGVFCCFIVSVFCDFWGNQLVERFAFLKYGLQIFFRRIVPSFRNGCFFGLFWGLGYYFFIMFGLFEQFGAFVCFYCFFLFLRQVYKCSYIVCFRYLLCDMVCVVHFSSVPYGQYLQVRLQSLPQSLLVCRVYGHRVSLFFFLFFVPTCLFCWSLVAVFSFQSFRLSEVGCDRVCTRFTMIF